MHKHNLKKKNQTHSGPRLLLGFVSDDEIGVLKESVWGKKKRKDKWDSYEFHINHAGH